MPQLQPLPEIGFVRLPDILARIPIGRTTWFEWVQAGKAPKGIHLGGRITAWKVEDIKKFIDELGKGGQA